MNLSGIIFHIEEDAYEKLNKYLSTIRSYFNTSEGRDEIMNDIESRIAEMLQEKVSQTKQAVLMMDVESVIAVMGKPEDFAGDNDNTRESAESNSTANSGTYTGKRRRVFRDPDEKMLGGVCSGIANYFDFDPLWLRAAFAISFFIFGSGFLLYLILWIIIPQAKTTAEKLEMRGEKVDVNNISKAVNEEFEDFKKRMKGFGDEIGSPENKQRVKSSTRRATEFVGDVLQNIIRVVGKIFAVFFAFLAIVLLVGLLATIFGKGTISAFDDVGRNIHFSLYEFGDAVFPNDLSMELIVIGIILFFGIPLISIIYKCIRFLFGIKHQTNKMVQYTATGLWLCGLVVVLYVANVIGNDFSAQASNKQRLEIKQPAGALYLDMAPAIEDDMDDVLNRRHRRITFGDWAMMSKDENKFRIGYPELNIVASETDSFELVAIKTAHGYDKKEAVNRAKNIVYSISQADSTILFNGYFDISNEDKLRAQDLQLVLKVPMNRVIYLGRRMERIIFDIDNVHNTLDSDMVDRRWIMTRRGLQCIDCEGLDNVSMIDSIPAPPPAPPAPGIKDSKKYFLENAVTFN
jgi:phage shock protein PspC (stress-responsive transcriptional regulator)